VTAETATGWTWRFLDAGGTVLNEWAPQAQSRFDAELWLGEHWRSLAERGVERARLLYDGAAVGAEIELRAFEY
jgi:hypothetical protein